VCATRSILRGTIRFEREGLKLQWGVRFALGVGIPLFIGAATGNLIEAVAISGGALMVGLTDSGAPYRGRVRAMLITCVSVAVCTFVGELAGHSAIVLVVLLAVASFGAGMFIALGLPTYFVALMAPLTITVVSSAPADAAHALERAALAFAGGLFAIALVLVLWRAHAHLPERRAIARVYRALAAWVRDPNADDRRPILDAQTEARQALDASVGSTAVPSPSVEAFRVLVDEAIARTSTSSRSASHGSASSPSTRLSRDAPSTSVAAPRPRRSSPSRKRSNLGAGRRTPTRSAPVSTTPSPRCATSSRSIAPPVRSCEPMSSKRCSDEARRYGGSSEARSIWPRPGRVRGRPPIPCATHGRGARSSGCAAPDRSCAPT
jgi:FUSC-like inner membrane protein yccS